MGLGARVGCAALVAALVVPAVANAAPYLTARAAIVMDATSGEVLWERDGLEPMPPASTTKVMTAILALESDRLDDSMRVSVEAASAAPSKISLRPGQRMRLRNLLYAVLLNSANDAAVVVAEGLAGSESAFAERMTARAHELGARTANFENPHGLTESGHVASARDLAVIFRHGLDVPLFRQILETRTVEVPVESTGVHWVTLRSHNRLLTGYSYPVIGKTGYTRAARRCFVGAASHDNREIVIALLGATDLWGDARRLIAFGFGGVEDKPQVVMAGLVPLVVPPANTPRATAEGDEDDSVASRYAVQLGPYPSRKTAVSTRAKLARRGYLARLSGRALRVGSFSTRNRALRVATRLRLTGYNTQVIALR